LGKCFFPNVEIFATSGHTASFSSSNGEAQKQTKPFFLALPALNGNEDKNYFGE
jgi:hypothetical protein